MIVAQEKRKNNIAEYILYMWQVEDTLRALNFDMNLVEERLITQFKQRDRVLDDIRNWYTNLILAMHEEDIKKKGHLKIVQSTLNELVELHKRLIYEIRDQDYIDLYTEANPNIIAFREKLKMPDISEIEVCFYGLYGLLLLRIKKKEVSKETSKAMQTFSNMISALSTYFHRIEQGKAEF